MPYKNPADEKDRNRRYYAQHRKRIKQAAKKWASDHLDRKRQISRESRKRLYKGSSAKDRKRASEWQKRYPDRAQERNARRRARKLGAFVESVNRNVLFKRDAGRCGICGCPVDPNMFHVEHRMPLEHGGKHSYANTQIAHPLCNFRKGRSVPSVDFTPAPGK